MASKTSGNLSEDLSTFLNRQDLPDQAKTELSAILARMPLHEAPPVAEGAFEQVMDHNPYAMGMFNSQGQWVRGNNAFVKLFGSLPPAGYSIFEDPLVQQAGILHRSFELKEGKILEIPELWYDPHDFLPDRPSILSCLSIVMFPLMDDSGEMQQVVAMYEDITARKLAEQNQVQSERMAATGTLAAGVAHEFNNINTRVVGFAEMGLNREAEGSEQRQVFEKIIAAARRGREITRDLLTFAGRHEQGLRPDRLDELVKGTISLIENELETSGVVLERRLEPVPESALSETGMSQVVMNLLINAHHAVLEAANKTITVTTGSDDGHVWLQVQDTGCGIPAEERQNIFTPFFSTKGEHADRDSRLAGVTGTGLGLPVCLAIVRDQGGDLTVESTVGEGSTFTLRLPIREMKPAAEPSALPAVRAPISGARVAVIDDEPDLRFLLGLLLEEEGCEVQETDDGAEALSWIEAGEIDLVVADLIMPKMTGHELLDHLRRIPAERRPGCLLIAGLPSRLSPEDLEGLDAVAVLGKPYERQEVKDALAELLAASRGAA